MAIVFSHGLVAEADAYRDSDVRKFEASTSIYPLHPHVRVRAGTGESVVFLKKEQPRKRSWPLPLQLAEIRAERYAERFLERTSPGDFDLEDPAVADRVWKDSFEDGCERINRSRVSCYWRVESDSVDVYDDEGSGDYLFSDYFLYEVELVVWYTRARKKSLREKSKSPDCYWDTVDDGSDDEDPLDWRE